MDTQLERLEQLGVITLADSDVKCLDCDAHHLMVTLTAAGVPITVELVREVGIPVDVLAAAADALVAEITGEDREPAAVMFGLQAVAEVVGDLAAPAIRRQVGGPHDGLVLHWLSNNAELDPESVDPARLLGGLVDVLAVTVDIGGPEALIADMQGEEDMLPELAETLCRMDHPRVGEVLEVLGEHHPAKPVRKAARKSLMKYRSR